MPFDVIGDQAQWLTIYEFLDRLKPNIGDIITFDAFEEACGFDLRTHRSPWYKATSHWCNEHHRAFVPVTGVGYRVARPTEHEVLARKQHRKSKRSMKRGLTVIRNTDHTELSPADRARFQRIESELARQHDVIRRIDMRQDRMERALEEGRRAHEQAQQEQDEMKARLGQLEKVLTHHQLDER